MAPLAAGFGLAALFVHRAVVPGTGFGSPIASAAAYLDSPGFWTTAAVLTCVLAATRWTVSRLVARYGAVSPDAVGCALTPLLWGAAVPSISPLLDAFFFWPSAPPLAALGLTVGALWVMRRWPAHGETSWADSVGFRLPLAVGAATAALFLIVDWSPPGGDEPHYLVVARSLVSDGDLDLADDYRRRVYAPYHPSSLSPHYKPGKGEGTRYSMHGLGLPVVLAPAYALGSLLGPAASVALPRTLLALLYGVFAWVLYGFIAESVSARAAAYGTAATTLLAPLLFAPLFIFPEVPAMLLALVAFRGLCLGDRPDAARRGHEIWCGLALAALPWVGVKYIPLAATVFLAGLWCAVPGGRVARGWRAGAPLAAGLLAHALFTWVLYGSISPAAVYLGAGSQAGAPALGGDWGAYVAAWPSAVATGIGYVLDQKEGLLAYGPHFLLAIAGLGWLSKKKPGFVALLALVATSYIGPYALSQQLSGHGPPVRPLMAVLWVLAPALGAGIALDATHRWYAVVRGATLALSAMLTSAYATQPHLLPHDYPVVASRLLQNYTPYGSGWWRLFPQWVNVEQPNVVATSVWTLAVIALGICLWRCGRRADVPAGLAAATLDSAGSGASNGARQAIQLAGWRAATAIVALACAFVLVHHLAWPLTDRHRPTPMEAGPVAWVAERLPEVAWAETGGVWVTPGDAVDFVLTSREPLEALPVSLRVLLPADVEVSVQGASTRGPAAPGSNQQARLDVGPGRRGGNGYAYHGRLYASRGVAPARLSGGADERYLGVFFEIR